MKLWEALPQLRLGQKLKVTYKDASQDVFTCVEGSLRREENGTLITMHRANLEADFELIPQSVPFEEALKALREGKTIACEHEVNLHTVKRTEKFEITPKQAEQNFAITVDVMLNGKWWVK